MASDNRSLSWSFPADTSTIDVALKAGWKNLMNALYVGISLPSDPISYLFFYSIVTVIYQNYSKGK